MKYKQITAPGVASDPVSGTAPISRYNDEAGHNVLLAEGSQVIREGNSRCEELPTQHSATRGKRWTSPVGDPGFEPSAEALALFMRKDAVISFAELRMTMQSLFSQSEMLPILTGGEQIQNLRLYIIQP